ncbi:MAG TPA: class I SAM-dependent methyltransferase [Pseudonocardiaceae bacterium]|nr:class I SAM-dependent methyltransferase [Pseudonocardiaceae bacterium]
MLTVDFDRFPVRAGNRLLDVGAGTGRHAFAAYRRGADVVALDTDGGVLKDVRDMFAAMASAGEAPADASALAVHGDGTSMPFPDGAFDRVIAAEMLEHVPADRAVLAEISRVLAPGGLLAVTVPRWWPERICWALSSAYHEVQGGHVRIYRRHGLRTRITEAGLVPGRWHHAHALHVPWWWLICVLGDEHRASQAYHRFLCWDLTARPVSTRLAERLLNPVLGKSLVCYARKPAC